MLLRKLAAVSGSGMLGMNIVSNHTLFGVSRSVRLARWIGCFLFKIKEGAMAMIL